MRLTLFLLLISTALHAQQSMNWSPPEIVNNDPLYGYVRPKIIVTASGNKVAMWGRAFDHEIYYSTDTGNGFTAPQQLSPPGMSAFVQHWGGPDMASGGDTVFIAFKAQPEDSGVVYTMRSIDGGVSFEDTVRVSNDNWSRFSEISVMPGGNPVVTYMQMDPNFTDPRYVVAVSSDGGQTYSNPIDGTFNVPGEVCDCCPGFIRADGQKILLMFRNNDNDLRDIWAAISTDGGNTFNIAADVDHTNWMINSCPATGPHAITDKDSIYYAWTSGGAGIPKVYIGSADLQNLNTAINKEVHPNSINAQKHPKIAGSGSVFGVSWQESRGGSTNILFSLNTNGLSGLSQSLPDTVNSSLGGTKVNVDMVYKNGVFHFIWQDNPSQSVIYRSAQINSSSLIKFNSEALEIYPNPADEFIIIEEKEKNKLMNYVLYDSKGIKMPLTPVKIGEKWMFQVKELEKGIYIIAPEGKFTQGQTVIVN